MTWNDWLEKLNPLAISLCYGKMDGRGPDGFAVIVEGDSLAASRSLNCLVEPEPGDLVLVSRDTFGRAYIISILERDGDPDVRLNFEGDVSISALSGRLTAAAAEGIDLVSSGDLNLFSGSIKLDADQADVKVGKARIMGKTIEYVFERLTARLRNSYRRIMGLDHKEAGELNYDVESVLNLRAKFAAMTAEEVVRVDAEKILMG